MSMTGRCLCDAVSFTAEDIETDAQKRREDVFWSLHSTSENL